MTGHPDHPPRPLRRLWELISPDRSDIWLVFLFASGVGILSLATPIAIEALVNTVANVGLREPVIILALIMFGCLALAAAMTAMQAFVVECIQRRIFVRVAADFAHRLPRVRLESCTPDEKERRIDIRTTGVRRQFMNQDVIARMQREAAESVADHAATVAEEKRELLQAAGRDALRKFLLALFHGRPEPFAFEVE